MPYNELSEAERVRYAEYLGVDCEAMEAVEQAVNGTLCFQLENRKPKSTAADLKRIAAEIELEMLTESARILRNVDYMSRNGSGGGYLAAFDGLLDILKRAAKIRRSMIRIPNLPHRSLPFSVRKCLYIKKAVRGKIRAVFLIDVK